MANAFCIKTIISRRRRSSSKTASLYFFDQIPPGKLENARQAYAAIQPEEQVYVLKDDTFSGSAKKGYLLTERALYSNIYGSCLVFKWKDIYSLYRNGHRIVINDEPFLPCSAYRDYEWDQFLMIHEIYRNLLGVSVRLSAADSALFPARCVGCMGDPFKKRIRIEMRVPRGRTAFGKHATKFGLPGMVLKGADHLIMDDMFSKQSVGDILWEYQIPVCMSCWSQLTSWERKGGPGLGAIQFT